MIRDMEQAKCLQNAQLIFSMWSGYLRREEQKPLLSWVQGRGMPLIQCHTSGHATVHDLKCLARAIAPRMLVPVHSFNPEAFAGLFENVKCMADGIWWEPV